MMRFLDKIEAFEIYEPILGVDEKHHIELVEKYLESDGSLDYK